MDAHLINRLLSNTGVVLSHQVKSGTNPGRPFSREASFTPYEYSVLITVKQEKSRPLEFMISSPASMADALAGGEEESTPELRLMALARLAQDITKRAVSHLPANEITVETPRGVVGWDVMVPSLRFTARRICVPFSGEAGSLLVEAGVHTLSA